MEIRWKDGFEISTRIDGEQMVISANREGLLSLVMQLQDMAEQEAGCHIHYDENTSLEEGSVELIIEKVR